MPSRSSACVTSGPAAALPAGGTRGPAPLLHAGADPQQEGEGACQLVLVGCDAAAEFRLVVHPGLQDAEVAAQHRGAGIAPALQRLGAGLALRAPGQHGLAVPQRLQHRPGGGVAEARQRRHRRGGRHLPDKGGGGLLAPAHRIGRHLGLGGGGEQQGQKQGQQARHRILPREWMADARRGGRIQARPWPPSCGALCFRLCCAQARRCTCSIFPAGGPL
ncbi:hypothetical protein ACFQU7_19155 [Pseudoroseomonas wenyumeiae]